MINSTRECFPRIQMPRREFNYEIIINCCMRIPVLLAYIGQNLVVGRRDGGDARNNLNSTLITSRLTANTHFIPILTMTIRGLRLAGKKVSQHSWTATWWKGITFRPQENGPIPVGSVVSFVDRPPPPSKVRPTDRNVLYHSAVAVGLRTLLRRIMRANSSTQSSSAVMDSGYKMAPNLRQWMRAAVWVFGCRACL